MCAEGTAAGQVSARHLRHLYRVEKLRKTTKIYGVIADPVRHSHFARRAQPRVSIAAHRRRVPAVPGHSGAPARFLRAWRNGCPWPGFSVTIPHKQKIIRYLDVGGSAGAAHRRGEHGVAQGRQVARHQYRRGRRHRSAGAAAAAAEILGADRGQRRRGARRGLRAGRCRRQNHAGGPQSRPRARAGQDLRRRGAGARAARRAHFDAVVHATPLGMFPHVDECFFDGSIPGGRGLRHGLQSAGDGPASSAPGSRARP